MKMSQNIWLLVLTLSLCLSLGETQLDANHVAVQRLMESKEFKDALSESEILKSTHDIFRSFGQTSNISACFNYTIRLLNNTAKLMQYFDAAGKPRSAISLGNLAWLGSFDSCQDISDAHYCLSNLNFDLKIVLGARNNTNLPVQWGGCFPKSCQSSDLDGIFKYILEKVNHRISNYLVISHAATVCPVKPKYTTDVQVTLAFCGLLLLFCLLGTIIDVWRGFTDSQTATKHLEPSIQDSNVTKIPNNPADESCLSYIRDFNHQTTDITAPLTPNDVTPKPPKKMHITGCLDFLLCFSILRNTTKIFDTKVPSIAITSVNGVRVISMFWVIMGHTFLFMFISSLMENPVSMLNDSTKFSMMVISNGYFSVDSFFFLSGLLVAYTGFRKMEKSDGRFNWIIFYLHRYFRLTPSLMFVILFYVKLVPYLVYSPLWYRQNDKLCGQYWWTNLIYINNFYPKKFVNGCLSWSWYLANDMQFFIITPLFLITSYRFGWRGLFASAGSVLLICSIVIASLFGYFNIDPMALGRFSGTHLFSDSMKNKFENIIYDKPYSRIQPYLVGFFLGYYMHRSYSGTRKPSWIIAILCWLVAIATGLSVLYAPHNTIKVGGRTWSTAENVIYGTSERFLWAVVLAWLTYACHNGYGGFIQRFLSAKFWIPLSRLTYSAYLVHPILLTFMFSGARSTIFYSVTTITYYFISAIVLAYGAAFILAVVIEFPCDNLENLVLKSFRKRT